MHGHRPAIDPLFRSAAVGSARGAVRVVLSGALDDGSSTTVEAAPWTAIRVLEERVTIARGVATRMTRNHRRAVRALGDDFANLDSGLPVAEMLDDIRTRLADGAAPVHRKVSGVTRRGRQIKCPVKITPLLAQRGDGRGAIVLSEEVDVRKDRDAT